MANVSAPKGLIPVRHLNGSPWNGLTVPFLCPSSDGTAIFIGDIVKMMGNSGAAGLVVGGYDCEGMAMVNRDTTGTSCPYAVGVVVGFSPDPTNLMNKHRVASTNRVAHVVVDPTVVYEIQEDAVTTPVAAASVGLLAAYTTTAGSATTGVSAIALDSDSVNTTVTLPLKILGLSKKVGNALNTAGAGSDPATFDVVFNSGWFMPNVVGV